MKGNQAVIGLDIGTTSTKAVLFGTQGKVISKHSVPYDLIHPQPAWVEQNPEHILDAVIASVRGALTKAAFDAKNLIGVGISTAMHSLIVMDENGKALTNSIIWADNRSAEQAKRIITDLDGFQSKSMFFIISSVSMWSIIQLHQQQDCSDWKRFNGTRRPYVLQEFR